jgi:hypothetical protein
MGAAAAQGDEPNAGGEIGVSPQRHLLILVLCLIPPVIIACLAVVGREFDCTFFATGGPNMCSTVMEGALPGILTMVGMFAAMLSFFTLPTAFVFLLIIIAEAIRRRYAQR